MSRQRKRGRDITFYPQTLVLDRRGNKVRMPDRNNPITIKGWVIPQRSARAEVPGQVGIDVIRVGAGPELQNIGLWSQCDLDGRTWDVVSPPALHFGDRRTRHWSIDMRARPSGKGTDMPDG